MLTSRRRVEGPPASETWSCTRHKFKEGGREGGRGGFSEPICREEAFPLHFPSFQLPAHSFFSCSLHSSHYSPSLPPPVPGGEARQALPNPRLGQSLLPLLLHLSSPRGCSKGRPPLWLAPERKGREGEREGGREEGGARSGGAGGGGGVAGA